MHATRSPHQRGRVCSYCSRSFAKEDHLVRHIRKHTGEKPFSCSTCGKAYSRYDSLLRHSRSHAASSSTVPSRERRSVPPQYSVRRHGISSPAGSIEAPGLDPTPAQETAAELAAASAIGTESSDRQMTLAQQPDFIRDGLASDLQPSQPVWDGTAEISLHPMRQTDPYLEQVEVGPQEQREAWSMDLASQAPAWMTYDDVDLNSLNASIMASTGWFDCPHSLVTDPTISIGAPQRPSETISVTERPEERIRRQWFTPLSTPSPAHITPDGRQEQSHVDEGFRNNLVERLQQRVPTEPLPSTDFLNLCIQMYFTRFNPVFPIIHGPTFRPSKQRSLLLLSICSVGSLFLCSNHAASQGMRIFETLNKAILASWESYLTREMAERLPMIQAAVIGQTFGMLNGRPQDLILVQTFHGTVITWARKSGIFKQHQPLETINEKDIDREPEETWMLWLQAEEQIRLVAALCILDAEFSDLFLGEPFIRRRPDIQTADNELWTARTAKDWSKTLKRRLSRSAATGRTPRPDLFRGYFTIEGITAGVSDPRGSEDSINTATPSQTASLLQAYDEYIGPLKRSENSADKFCLQALWHANFLASLVNFERLELAVGREGAQEAQSQLDYAIQWAQSPNGRRCAVHAVLTLHAVEAISVGAEPPIHVPRVLYRATLVWFCFIKFGLGAEGVDTTRQNDWSDYPEFEKLGVDCDRLLFEAYGFRPTRPKTVESNTLYQFVDLLGRIGHWGIARKLASTCKMLLGDVTEGGPTGA